MKKITLILVLFTFSNTYSQYSNYYQINRQSNSNINANIKQSINVSGTVRQNISTIDYGQLAIANAQSEKNRFERVKYNNENERLIALEIFSNPISAYKYGNLIRGIYKGKEAKNIGFKRVSLGVKVPHKSIFDEIGAGRLHNVSSDNITTEILFTTPRYNKENNSVDIENKLKRDDLKIGAINETVDGEIFVHKKDLNKALVWGVNGFKGTIISEDNYQIYITDYYESFDNTKGNGINYFFTVKTFADKDLASFEQLEGRRHYLKRLVEKVISGAYIYDEKY